VLSLPVFCLLLSLLLLVGSGLVEAVDVVEVVASVPFTVVPTEPIVKFSPAVAVSCLTRLINMVDAKMWTRKKRAVGSAIRPR